MAKKKEKEKVNRESACGGVIQHDQLNHVKSQLCFLPYGCRNCYRLTHEIQGLIPIYFVLYTLSSNKQLQHMFYPGEKRYMIPSLFLLILIPNRMMALSDLHLTSNAAALDIHHIARIPTPSYCQPSEPIELVYILEALK